MRTNTWLAIQTVQSEIHHHHLIGHLERAHAAQAERDRIRDEKFDRAALIAQRGQFAMWIQSPEGQIFDRWTTHASVASQEIEDRQSAWSMLMFAEYQSEFVGPNSATQGTSTETLTTSSTNSPGEDYPWDTTPWHRHLIGPQVSVVSGMIDNFVQSASQTLPRPSDLIPLSGIYFSHSPDSFEPQRRLSSAASDLLERFHNDDSRRVESLRADGFR